MSDHEPATGSQFAEQTLVAEAYKELVKGTIALPLEGCKSMATGCATVAGLYGATLVFANTGKLPSPADWHVYAMLAPFLLFALAGYVFATAYLPNVGLSTLLQPEGLPLDIPIQRQHIVAREIFLRKSIVTGSAVFWAGLFFAFLVVAFVRVP